jgi:hypothetical protein
MAAALPLYAELPITLLPGLSCSLRWHRHRRQLQWSLRIRKQPAGNAGEDGNCYGRFSVANSLGIQIPIFEDTSPSPSYCAPDLKVSANTVYLAGTGSVVILPSIPANSGR